VSVQTDGLHYPAEGRTAAPSQHSDPTTGSTGNECRGRDAVGAAACSEDSDQPDRRRAHISIEDTGPGIAGPDRGHISNPLFTTKTGGMGIGLSICRSIIENHGGRIGVEAVTGPGAIFQLVACRSKPDREQQIGRVSDPGRARD
jgi:signal transduction histidine kinase